MVYVTLRCASPLTLDRDHRSAGAADLSNVARGAHAHRRNHCRGAQLERRESAANLQRMCSKYIRTCRSGRSCRDLRQDLTGGCLQRPNPTPRVVLPESCLARASVMGRSAFDACRLRWAGWDDNAGTVLRCCLKYLCAVLQDAAVSRTESPAAASCLARMWDVCASCAIDGQWNCCFGIALLQRRRMF